MGLIDASVASLDQAHNGGQFAKVGHRGFLGSVLLHQERTLPSVPMIGETPAIPLLQ